MFSKKIAFLVGVVVLFFACAVLLSLNSRNPRQSHGIQRVAISIVSPFQKALVNTTEWVNGVWVHYFYLVNTAETNDSFRKELLGLEALKNENQELLLANDRLRKLLNFQDKIPYRFVSAEVIGKDPSAWIKTILIDKGLRDGVKQGMPVVVPAGAAGVVTEITQNYAKVSLIIDQNTGVDALVQRSRTRGVVRGMGPQLCQFAYALRKHDIHEGDTIVTSGMDQIFPKGIRIGQVSGVSKEEAGIFQQVEITPFVDFETIEEVIIIQLQLPLEPGL